MTIIHLLISFTQNLLLQPPTDAEYASGHPLGIPMLKVADFGFARSLPAAALAETLCGSPLYMAPEILRYEKYDAKADLWSVGAVLFEMAVGKPPFKATNHVELLKKIERNDDRIRFPDEEPSSRDEMEDYSELRNAPPVAQDIKELIRKLLKKKPVMRMSFNEFFDCKVWAGCMKQPRKSSHAAYVDSRSPRTEPRRVSTAANMLPQQRLSEEQQFRPSSSPRTGDVTTISRKASEPKHSLPSSPSPRREYSKADTADGVQTPKAAPRDIKPDASRTVSSGSDRHARESTESSGKTKGMSSFRDRERERSFSGPSPRQTPEIKTPSSHDIASNRRLSSSRRSSNHDIAPDTEEEADRKIQDSDEYVVVEKRNVEVNVLADGKSDQLIISGFYAHILPGVELDAAAKRPEALSRRRSSRMSALTRPISALAAGASAAASAVAGGSPVSYSPPFTMSSTPPFALPPPAQHHRPPSFHSVSSSPNLQTRTRPVLVPHSVTNYGLGLTYHQTAQDAQHRQSESASPASHGLTRVLTSAGMRFFGSPTNVLGTLSRRPWNRARNVLALREQDPEEEALVQKLDDLGQKAFVVFDFADSKLVLCTPNAMRPSPSLGASGVSPSSYLPSVAARRRSSAASSVSTELSSAKLDTMCAEALVLYVKALSFLQHGVDLARQYWDNRASSAQGVPTSPEFNESKYIKHCLVTLGRY